MEYPIAAVTRMLKKSNMRVSQEAVNEFAEILEEITADIAAEASANAKSRRRKTIDLEDVIAAERALHR